MEDLSVDPDPTATDYYDRLGVDPDDSTDDIEDVGNEILSRLSPDRDLPDPEYEAMEDRYYRAKEAFDVLTDEEQRAAYDRGEVDPTADDGRPPQGTATEARDPSPETDSPDPVALDVSAHTTQPVYGTAVTFAVTDDDGAPVENALVEVDDSTKGTTDGSGEVDLTVTLVGTVEVSATKSGDHYREDSVSIEVAPRQRALQVEVDSEEVALGDGASVLVRSEDGPVEDATVEVAGRTTDTDRHGQTKVEFPDVGSFDVVARKDGTEKGTTYRPDETSVTVTSEATPLDITAPDEEGNAVTVGEEAKFVVREVVEGTGESHRLGGATVTAGDRTKTTNSTGACWFSFPTPGTVEVTASVEDSSTTYRPDTVEITVESLGQLDVTATSDRIEPDQPVTFEVVGPDGRPVEGAMVEAVDRSERKPTDRHGEARLRFSESGGVTVRASKGDGPTRYESATTTVMVRAGGSPSTREWSRPSGSGPDLSMAVFVLVTLGLTVLSGAVLTMDLKPLVVGIGAVGVVVALGIVLSIVNLDG